MVLCVPLLLSVVPVSYSHVYPIRGQGKPEKEAERYSKLVESQVPMPKEWPVFDIVLLGAGEDGPHFFYFSGTRILAYFESGI